MEALLVALGLVVAAPPAPQPVPAPAVPRVVAPAEPVNAPAEPVNPGPCSSGPCSYQTLVGISGSS